MLVGLKYWGNNNSVESMDFYKMFIWKVSMQIHIYIYVYILKTIFAKNVKIEKFHGFEGNVTTFIF